MRQLKSEKKKKGYQIIVFVSVNSGARPFVGPEFGPGSKNNPNVTVI